MTPVIRWVRIKSKDHSQIKSPAMKRKDLTGLKRRKNTDICPHSNTEPTTTSDLRNTLRLKKLSRVLKPSFKKLSQHVLVRLLLRFATPNKRKREIENVLLNTTKLLLSKVVSLELTGWVSTTWKVSECLKI